MENIYNTVLGIARDHSYYISWENFPRKSAEIANLNGLMCILGKSSKKRVSKLIMTSMNQNVNFLALKKIKSSYQGQGYDLNFEIFVYSLYII